jgi:hypothetical protein
LSSSSATPLGSRSIRPKFIGLFKAVEEKYRAAESKFSRILRRLMEKAWIISREENRRTHIGVLKPNTSGFRILTRILTKKVRNYPI